MTVIGIEIVGLMMLLRYVAAPYSYPVLDFDDTGYMRCTTVENGLLASSALFFSEKHA